MFQFDFNLWLQGAFMTLSAAFIGYFLILIVYCSFTFASKFKLKGNTMTSYVKTLTDKYMYTLSNTEIIQLKRLLVGLPLAKV